METDFETMEDEQGDVRSTIRESVRELVRDAEEMLRATAGDLSEKAKVARARLADAVERDKEAGEQLQEKTAEAAKATDKIIRAHPYESIGVAFGVGLLLGLLFTRRGK